MSRYWSWYEWAMAALVAATAALFVAIGWMAVADSLAPSIEIRKDEWVCTSESTHTAIVPMIVGKVTVMQHIPRTRCDRYERSAPTEAADHD